MNVFEDNSFDIVLCFGPLYHLVRYEDRKNCIKECLRVLKQDGILAIAYISRFFIYPHVALSDKKYLSKKLISKIIDKGYINYDDEECFWTDAYFYSADEIEQFMNEFQVEFLDHAATDGLSPMLKDQIDSMTDDEFEIWLSYHMKTCREKSILGSSNHGLYICRKIV